MCLPPDLTPSSSTIPALVLSRVRGMESAVYPLSLRPVQRVAALLLADIGGGCQLPIMPTGMMTTSSMGTQAQQSQGRSFSSSGL
jgi:hypothetical protein